MTLTTLTRLKFLKLKPSQRSGQICEANRYYSVSTIHVTVVNILLYDLHSFLTEKQTDVLRVCLIFEVSHKI